MFIVCYTGVKAQLNDTICDVKYEIENTTDYPNNLVCRLTIKRRTAKTLWLFKRDMNSTGFFITPNVILTNGHNVASNMWTKVVAISVYPGYNKGVSVQDEFSIEKRKNVKKVVVVPKKYSLTKSKKKRFPFDYALIYLGNYKSPNEDSLQLHKLDPLLDDSVYTIGYPAAMFSDSSNHMSRTQGVNTIGGVQYFTSGDLKKDKFTSRRIFYFTCTKGGNSGSPVLINRGEDAHVVGIHNAEHSGVRVTDEVIETIDRWIKCFKEGRLPQRDHFIED